jgi:hypothetical protein
VNGSTKGGLTTAGVSFGGGTFAAGGGTGTGTGAGLGVGAGLGCTGAIGAGWGSVVVVTVAGTVPHGSSTLPA